MNILIIIFIVVILLFIICGIIFFIYKKRINLNNEKSYENKEIKELKKNKDFFKEYDVIKFKDWVKNESGIVISSGKINIFNKGINNNFVVKNLIKNKKINYKKIPKEKLVISKTDKLSGICIAPPGSGKTQALLLPTILYNIHSQDKPIMVITDPKPEIFEATKSDLINNGYEIINLSIKEIKEKGKYKTDFWNPFDLIKINLQKLLNSKNPYEQQEISNTISIEINFLVESFFKNNKDEKNGYWLDNGVLFLKFFISLFLLKIENEEINEKFLNFKNLALNINKFIFCDLRNEVNELIEINKDKKTINILKQYTGFCFERDENLKSFVGFANKALSSFDSNYLNILTSRTTFDLDKLVLENKPLAIFLTMNTSSTATESESILLSVYLELINKKIDILKNKYREIKKRVVWWFIDECGNIPKLNFLESIITFGRGYNNFALPIFQTEQQIKDKYSDTLLNACENKIIFNNDNDKLAERISKLSGENFLKTKKIENQFINNIPLGFLGLWVFKRKNKLRNFYWLPVTYYYMISNTKKILLKKPNYYNEAYLISDYLKETKTINQMNYKAKSNIVEITNEFLFDISMLNKKEDQENLKILEILKSLKKLINELLDNWATDKFKQIKERIVTKYFEFKDIIKNDDLLLSSELHKIVSSIENNKYPKLINRD